MKHLLLLHYYLVKMGNFTLIQKTSFLLKLLWPVNRRPLVPRSTRVQIFFGLQEFKFLKWHNKRKLNTLKIIVCQINTFF